METKILPPILGAALIVISSCQIAGAQTAPQPPTPLNWAADDGTRVAELTASGERREGKLVVLFTPAGAIDDKEESALLDRLDRGNAELRALVGRHPWQVVTADKITYYVSSDRFVSHASGRAAVFIPLIRVQDGRAPYLHEAGHELLAFFTAPLTPDPARAERVRTSRPLWLTEGLADYVGQTAAARAGIREGDVFDIGGLAGAGAVCHERLKGPRGAEIEPFIGGLGAPGALFTTERTEVAPTFYACGTSFTKFIVDRIGLQETIALVPLILAEGVLPRIEKLAGKPMAALRAEWRASIAPTGTPAVPIEPVTGILEMFKTHDVVALSEGNHGNEQGHAFRLALIRDPRFAAAVNDIVVEFGNAHYQAVIDRFVQGEPVAYEDLRKVWQDTTQRGSVWDRPIYEEFYRAVRDVNAALPVERRVRVLLGDTPIDWYAAQRSSPPRTDEFPASVIQREVLAKKRRALVIYGGMHLLRKRAPFLPPKDPALAPVAATLLRDFQSGSIVAHLDGAGARVFVVATSTDFDISTLQANIVEWRRPSLALIRGTSLGVASSLTYFPRSSPVIRGRGGIQETLQPDLAAVPPMQEVVDAILYLGPPSSITQSRLSRKLCADPAYVKMREERLSEFASMPAAAFKAECAAVLKQ